MGSLFNYLFKKTVLRSVSRRLLRPLLRFLVGVVAVPVFRFFLRKVIRLQELDKELEKDLEQWFQGSLILLVATANMEQALFEWAPPNLQSGGDAEWIFMGFRIMLAIGVIDYMPDQELFAVIHPGPPKLKFSRKYGIFREIREKFRAICKGYLCKHLNQSSPVFAILAAIATGWVGWVCYGIAIIQYLIIGLVTSRDKALDVLSEFDRQVAIRRRDLIEEFELSDHPDSPESAAALPEENTTETLPAPSPNIGSTQTNTDNVAIRSKGGYDS